MLQDIKSTVRKYNIIKRNPDNTEEIIYRQVGHEEAVIVRSLLEQNFVLQTRLDIRNNIIDKNTGKLMLQKTEFMLFPK